MNIVKKIVCGIAVAGIAVVPAMAGEHGGHHHGGNDGVRLAAEIIGVVRQALAPTPVVVHHPAPPPPPPEPPRRDFRHDHHRHEFRAPAPRHGGRR